MGLVVSLVGVCARRQGLTHPNTSVLPKPPANERREITTSHLRAGWSMDIRWPGLKTGYVQAAGISDLLEGAMYAVAL